MLRLVVTAAPIFSDNMVVQHGRPIPVWGYACPGEKVRVRFCVPGASAPEGSAYSAEVITTVKIATDEWRVMLPPLPAGLEGELLISDSHDEICFKNVLTGDVWFAGGQSNMEMELIHCKNGEAELAVCANPRIRFYTVVKRAVLDMNYFEEERNNKWQICAPDTAAMLSGAAYFFARKINADLNIPVGIISCSWGGTSISAWMSREQLQRSRAGRRYIDEYAAKIGGKTEEQYQAEMADYNEQWRAWDERVRARREQEPDIDWETLNKECGPCPWPQPAGSSSPYCPANLYTSRVRRAAPYALKVFLYYQGEEDESRYADYAEMMYYLVDQWRRDWGDCRLPFLFAQLAMYASREDVEAGQSCRNWCALQESQYHASLSIANCGMAVIIDCGEYDNIHPADKQTVGYRLALQALKKVYGNDVEADGPVLMWAVCESSEGSASSSGALRLHFAHAESGLEFHGAAEGFEIAGADGFYYPAQATIEGGDVILCSDRVPQPQRARYAWRKWGPAPLFAKNGLPAMPFRTNTDESPDL